jgi:putative redox protein
MNNILTVRLKTIDDKAMFSAEARENPAVVIDYFPPIGAAKGYTSLELLMMSFGSCVCTTLLSLLRYRMKKSIDGISGEVDGIVREEHPKALERISLRLHIRAKDLTETEVREALKNAEDSVCPVWAMIKGNVALDIETEISE